MRFRSPRVISTALLGLAAAVLAACAPEPPPPAPPPPPPPPPPPAVSLLPSVVQEAAAYRGFVDRANGIDPLFMNGLAVQQALKTGTAYEPRQFLRGAIAYAAIAALQDDRFVEGVRQYASSPAQRRELANQIVANPAYVVSFEGSDSAAGLVTRALHGDSLGLFNGGRAVKQSAYDIQRQDWSKAAVPDRDIRLLQTRAASSTPLIPDAMLTASLEQAVSGEGSLNIAGGPQQPPYTPLVVRALAVAAMAALGEAGEINRAQLDTLLSDPTTSYCLDLAKLNLYQCLAVAKPYYEDVFCLGQHSLMDTGQCLMKGSGAPMPIMVRPRPMEIPALPGGVKIIPPKTGGATAN